MHLQMTDYYCEGLAFESAAAHSQRFSSDFDILAPCVIDWGAALEGVSPRASRSRKRSGAEPPVRLPPPPLKSVSGSPPAEAVRTTEVCLPGQREPLDGPEVAGEVRAP